MTTLFISDLHLCKERQEITQIFIYFLEQEAQKASELYILGDLFEAWLGDDAVLDEYKPIIGAIKRLVDKGIPVYFMHGNRDFLIGEGFEKMTGCKIIPDPTVIQLNNEPVLLMHGDTLCTDDTEYQAFRAQVRCSGFHEMVMALPLEKRIELANSFREASREHTSHTSPDIMDVNQEAVNHTLCRHKVTTLIHGHTHRPAIHNFELDDQAAKRIVLGDWYKKGSVLTVDNTGFYLRAFC